MLRELKPDGVAGPAANYALGIEVTNPTRIVTTAGIVGDRPDGTIAPDAAGQAAELWRSISAILAEAGMGPSDIVSYTTYAVVGVDRAELQDARDRFLNGHLAASTLIYVPQLARPQWLVEVQVTAMQSA
jgi:2-iminobutanoate/2-iminopropanoate deaminase